MPVGLAAVAAALAQAAAPGPAPDADALPLERVYTVEATAQAGATALEPSGLALCDGRLLMVSDDHADWVFELRLRNEVTDGEVGRAEAEPYADLSSAPLPPRRGWTDWLRHLAGPDWEGIDCDAGALWLASEAANAVLKVELPSSFTWHFPELQAAVRAEGLLQTRNAGLEGLGYDARSRTGAPRWLLAAERQPRGLIAIDSDTAMRAVVPPASGILPEGLVDDYTGIAHWRGRWFALERNARRVCELTEQLATRECRSFGDTLEAQAWAYTTGEPYGLAEGLAMDDRAVWVVVDNNGQPRAGDEADRRPLLFRFANTFVQ